MQCLYVAGTMTECPLRRGVHLWEVKNAMLRCLCVDRITPIECALFVCS